MSITRTLQLALCVFALNCNGARAAGAPYEACLYRVASTVQTRIAIDPAHVYAYATERICVESPVLAARVQALLRQKGGGARSKPAFDVRWAVTLQGFNGNAGAAFFSLDGSQMWMSGVLYSSSAQALNRVLSEFDDHLRTVLEPT